MKSQVKKFGDWLNESKFYHSIPQGDVKLRDRYKELSDEEKDEISDLAKELDELDALASFKKGMSKYKSIPVLKRAMQTRIKEAKKKLNEQEGFYNDAFMRDRDRAHMRMEMRRELGVSLSLALEFFSDEDLIGTLENIKASADMEDRGGPGRAETREEVIATYHEELKKRGLA